MKRRGKAVWPVLFGVGISGRKRDGVSGKCSVSLYAQVGRLAAHCDAIISQHEHEQIPRYIALSDCRGVAIRSAIGPLACASQPVRWLKRPWAMVPSKSHLSLLRYGAL